MKITKIELATSLYLVLVLGWILGRITESIALGNLSF